VSSQQLRKHGVQQQASQGVTLSNAFRHHFIGGTGYGYGNGYGEPGRTPLSKRDLTLSAWERYTEWPLIVAALIFLATYAIPIIWPNLDLRVLEFDTHIFIIVWSLFLFDFVMRFGLAHNRRKFFRRNLIDFFSILLPFIRPLRVLRVLTVLATLNRIGWVSIRRQVMAYTVGLVSVITFVAALAVTNAERGVSGSNINSFGDGIWWAFVTLSTVGYGDMSPVTVVGRVIGVILMLSGVLLLGVIAATMASWLVQHSQTAAELVADTDALVADTDALVADEGGDGGAGGAGGASGSVPSSPVTLDSLQDHLTQLSGQVDRLTVALARQSEITGETAVSAMTPLTANKEAI